MNQNKWAKKSGSWLEWNTKRWEEGVNCVVDGNFASADYGSSVFRSVPSQSSNHLSWRRRVMHKSTNTHGFLRECVPKFVDEVCQTFCADGSPKPGGPRSRSQTDIVRDMLRYYTSPRGVTAVYVSCIGVPGPVSGARRTFVSVCSP